MHGAGDLTPPLMRPRDVNCVGLSAIEATPSGENIFFRKPDPDFLLVICWHVLPNSYRFRVIRENSIRFATPDPDFSDPLHNSPTEADIDVGFEFLDLLANIYQHTENGGRSSTGSAPSESIYFARFPLLCG
jgi:hypothetical protein